MYERTISVISGDTGEVDYVDYAYGNTQRAADAAAAATIRQLTFEYPNHRFEIKKLYIAGTR